MSRFILRLFSITLLLSAVYVSPARSELVHGFLTLYPGYEPAIAYHPCWGAADFSAQEVVLFSSNEADLCYDGGAVNNANDWGMCAINGSEIAYFGLTALDNISVAPEDGYFFCITVMLNMTFVIKTHDGVYAKFKVRELNGGLSIFLTIEYYVQMDGTRNLDTVVPVLPTTWGRVKALYR